PAAGFRRHQLLHPQHHRGRGQLPAEDGGGPQPAGQLHRDRLGGVPGRADRTAAVVQADLRRPAAVHHRERRRVLRPAGGGGRPRARPAAHRLPAQAPARGVRRDRGRRRRPRLPGMVAAGQPGMVVGLFKAVWYRPCELRHPAAHPQGQRALVQPRHLHPRNEPGGSGAGLTAPHGVAMHDTLLLFGATGDLARRYLFPSLRHLLRDRLLPPSFRVVAVGRSEHDDDGFRDWLRGQLEDDDNGDSLDDLLARTRYHAIDLTDGQAIAAALAQYTDRPSVSYLSVPPDLFAPACRGLQAAGLLKAPSRLVLEKPIGHDLESARGINAVLREALDESRIFRIDHYLGKAPVQNLMALRLGNTLLEAVWNHQWIESVDIIVAETAGVEGREDYYAGYGALRDMVQ